MLKRIALAAALAATFALGAAALGVAGNGGGPNKSSISLVMPSASASTASSSGPHFGDQVTFSVSTDAPSPFVNLDCYQSGRWIYDEWHGFWEGAMGGQTFTLSSTYWQGGDADCTARLVEWQSNGHQRTLASTSFHVSA